MRIHRNLLGWGVFFIVAGAIPFAAQVGVILPNAIERWWSFWPLLLVGTGLGMILTRTPFEVLGGLVVSATLGLMVGGAAASGFGGFSGLPSGVCTSGDSGVDFAPRSGDLGSPADVSIEVDCGDLRITVGEGDLWSIEGQDDEGGGPQIESSSSELRIRPTDGGPTGPFGGREAWQVRLPSEPRLSLALDLNAGRIDADLAGGHLGVVDVQLNAGQASIDLQAVAEILGIELGVNAGELAVTLPEASMTGAIEVNAGSVRLCVPGSVALRLETGDSVLSSQDFGSAGLVQNGSTWETPGFDSAVHRIELRTEANAGSFRLNPAEGC